MKNELDYHSYLEQIIKDYNMYKKQILTKFQKHLHYSSWYLYEEKKLRIIFGDFINDNSFNIEYALKNIPDNEVIDMGFKIKMNKKEYYRLTIEALQYYHSEQIIFINERLVKQALRENLTEMPQEWKELIYKEDWV